MPDSLFLFCPTNNELRRTWLEKILIDSEVYFRSREQLNDPHELRPKIIFEGSDKQIRDYVRRLLHTGAPRLSPAKRLLEESRFIYRLRNGVGAFEHTLHDLLDRIGLLCLSKSSEDTLLWAHYADGHRGVCIEFDANIGLFSIAQQVDYTDQVPLVNRLIDSNEDILQKSMYTKNIAWKYEQEWRVIARWQDAVRIERHLAQHEMPESVRRFMENQHGSGYYSFPPEAIRSVILGTRIDPDVENWVRETIRSAQLDLPIYLMKEPR